MGFEGHYELMLLQRKGKAREPPKHWTQAQVELQEMRGLVVIGRAAGTWTSYARWWRLFAVHARTNGQRWNGGDLGPVRSIDGKGRKGQERPEGLE